MEFEIQQYYCFFLRFGVWIERRVGDWRGVWKRGVVLFILHNCWCGVGLGTTKVQVYTTPVGMELSSAWRQAGRTT